MDVDNGSRVENDDGQLEQFASEQLIEAAMHGEVALVRRILARDHVSPDASRHGWSLLAWAIVTAQVDAIDLLTSLG